jgi:hypothetical protein
MRNQFLIGVETYYNVGIGVVACLFVLELTIAYNHFLKETPQKKLI